MSIFSSRWGRFAEWASNSRDHISYALIALVVFIFNLVAIFGLDILLGDDPVWYGRVVEDQFPLGFAARFSQLYALKEWMAWHIMAYSPQLARGLYVVFLMIPISCCFYYLFHRKLGFARPVAFTAAVLPNILPYQWQIPVSINFSYTLWGVLLSVLSLLLAFNYLEKNDKRNWIRFAGVVICNYVAVQLMEQTVFLLPPSLLLLLGYTKLNKKHIWLAACYVIPATAKIVKMISQPRIAMEKVPLERILEQLGFYLKTGLPFPDINPLLISIIFITVTLAGITICIGSARSSDTAIIKKPRKGFSHLEGRTYILYVYGFLVCWFLSAIFVFAFLLNWVSPRYGHISAFASNAVFILSFFALLKRLFPGKQKMYTLIFVVIIIFSGTYRHLRLERFYAPKNYFHSIVVRDLNKVDFPLNSQVVVVLPTYLRVTHGFNASSGYLKYALKRNDINGLVGLVNNSGFYNFDDHFNPLQKGFRLHSCMRGLSDTKPTFLFFMGKKKRRLKQFTLALQWRGKTKNSPWQILEFNKKTGRKSIFRSGNGMQEYRDTLKGLEKKGIFQHHIMWGGPPTPAESKRLGLTGPPPSP